MVVKVAVEAGYGDFDKLYDYAVPLELAGENLVGKRVSVPFGRGKRVSQGVVFAVSGRSPYPDMKFVIDVSAEYPPLSAELLQLADWLHDYTFCTYYSAVRTIQPNVSNKPAMREVLSLGTDYPRTMITPKRRIVIDWLAAHPDERLVAVELAAKCGISLGIVKGLIKRNVILTHAEYKTKLTYERQLILHKEIVLTEHQQNVYDNLCELYEQPVAKCALLRGVTGSGKTAVFVKLIEKTLVSGKTAIMLVPEISLTPQTVIKFSEIFGSKVAILHSGLSDGERAGEYARARNGDAKIVIGTRSAVFAPLENIGVVIIDEESEHSYKSEQTPRYHARDAAKQRCFYHNALLLLASATPAVESYYFAKIGRYTLCELYERYNVSPLPAVSVVDMRNELPQTVISRPFMSAIRDTLKRGEQVLILLNRRGFSTRVACTKCGWIYYCLHCALPLNYHAHGGIVKCHYCNFKRYMPSACPDCGSDFLRQTGTGTQKVEAVLAQFFPQARLLRMDGDTAVTKNVYERSFAAFAAGEYDIMLGTQMIAKGLDFPNVTLVGVLSVDNALCAGDYQAYERVFSLITQVVGRCGRGSSPGHAFLQTYIPEHYVIKLAAFQDYEEFYRQEIDVRREFLFPPFCDICLIIFADYKLEDAMAAAERFVVNFKAQTGSGYVADRAVQTYDDYGVVDKDNGALPYRMYEPSQYGAGNILGRFRVKIVIKCKNGKKFRSVVSAVVNKTKTEFRKTRIHADMNGHIM